MRTKTRLENPFANPIVYESKTINKYLTAMENMRPNTYKSAKHRLSLLPAFAEKLYNMTPDALIQAMKEGMQDRYDVLNAYAAFLKNQKKKTATNVRKRVSTAREMLEFHSVEFSDRQYRIKVKLERGIKRAKTATDKMEIAEVLQAATHDPFLQLALIWHAATGRRPEEIFSLRHCDLNLDKKPFATFKIRGEFTKMGDEQERPMTRELATRSQRFIQWKHRPRSIVVHHKIGEPETIYVEPVIRPTDLLFAPYYRDETHVVPNINNVYDTYQTNLANLLDSIGKGDRINADDPRSPRKFTFYRLRDHVKTTISDLGYGDFAEYLIGHQHSTYYNQPEKKRQEVYAKVEPYLTYLDVTGLEARGADIASQIQEIKNQEIAQLKDVIMSLSDRITELEQKGQPDKKPSEQIVRMLKPATRKTSN